jgi:hypothetical protein
VKYQFAKLGFAAVCLLILETMACTNKSPAEALKLSSSVSFQCLWWSPDQMNGLDPNSPPSKTTAVTIQKWEYSDPISVPHPDVLNVVVQITNESGVPAADTVVEISGLWKVGPFKNERLADWSTPVLLEKAGPFALAAHETKIVRASVNLAQKMTELQKAANWPYGLRVNVTLTRLGSSSPIGVSQAELPIIAGD